jgi:hypothetical protein
MAGPQAAFHNCRSVAVINLAVQGFRGLPTHYNHGDNDGRYSLHFERIILAMSKFSQVGIVSDHFQV